MDQNSELWPKSNNIKNRKNNQNIEIWNHNKINREKTHKENRNALTENEEKLRNKKERRERIIIGIGLRGLRYWS